MIVEKNRVILTVVQKQASLENFAWMLLFLMLQKETEKLDSLEMFSNNFSKDVIQISQPDSGMHSTRRCQEVVFLTFPSIEQNILWTRYNNIQKQLQKATKLHNAEASNSQLMDTWKS